MSIATLKGRAHASSRPESQNSGCKLLNRRATSCLLANLKTLPQWMRLIRRQKVLAVQKVSDAVHNRHLGTIRNIFAVSYRATVRNPQFPLEDSGVFEVRAATRYLLQYES